MKHIFLSNKLNHFAVLLAILFLFPMVAKAQSNGSNSGISGIVQLPYPALPLKPTTSCSAIEINLWGYNRVTNLNGVTTRDYGILSQIRAQGDIHQGYCTFNIPLLDPRTGTEEPSLRAIAQYGELFLTVRPPLVNEYISSDKVPCLNYVEPYNLQLELRTRPKYNF